MSWSINVTGTLSGVRRKIEGDKNIPAGIKATLFEIIDEPNARTGGITVKGSGHSGGGYGYINELKAERVELELTSAPAPAEAPPAAYPDGNPLARE